MIWKTVPVHHLLLFLSVSYFEESFLILLLSKKEGDLIKFSVQKLVFSDESGSKFLKCLRLLIDWEVRILEDSYFPDKLI